MTLPGVRSRDDLKVEHRPKIQSSIIEPEAKPLDAIYVDQKGLAIFSKLSDDIVMCIDVANHITLSQRLCPEFVEIVFTTKDDRYSELFPPGEDFNRYPFFIRVEFGVNIDITKSSTELGEKFLVFYLRFVDDNIIRDMKFCKVNGQNYEMYAERNINCPTEQSYNTDDKTCDTYQGPMPEVCTDLVVVPNNEVIKTGISNSGNTCYQNSILQAFVRMQPWRAFVDTYLPRIPDHEEYFLLRKLAVFTEKINSGQQRTMSADMIRTGVKKHTTLFENNQQQDAPEYFDSLISGLNLELKKFLSNRPTEEDENDEMDTANSSEGSPTPIDNSVEARDKRLRQLSNQRWKEFFRTQPTPLTDLFCGQIAQRLICQECSYESSTIEPFEVLILNLPQATVPYQLLFFARDPITCCCTEVKKYVFRFPPDVPVENLLAALSNCVGCPMDNIRLVQRSPDGEQFPIGLKTKCLLSDTVRDPGSQILAFQSEQSDDIVEFSILQKTLLRHLNPLFHHIVPITDRELDAGRQAIGLPFIVYMKRSLMTYTAFTKVLMSYALKSVNARILLHSNQHLNLAAMFSEIQNYPTLVYYKSKLHCTGSELLAPFLLKDHGSNQEIMPKTDGERYYGDEPLDFYGYCMELQWINETNSERFPRYGMIDTIGNHLFHELPVSLQYEHHSNLQDCLKIFSKEEDLGHDACWKCKNCKQVRVAKKSAHLIRTPHMLVIQLVRFKFNENETASKVHDRIEFPIDGFDLSDWVFPGEYSEIYDLYAVVNHYGHCFGGHYSVAVREWPSENDDNSNKKHEWYLYDDSCVTPLDPEKDLVTSFAYLLFFKRRQFPDSKFKFTAQESAEQTTVSSNIDCD